MKTLFENNSPFDLVSLRDLGSRYLLTQGDEQIKVIGFQRNAVWKEEKVEALWDSFLSGFPIGSILLARQEDYWVFGTKPVQLSRANDSEDTIVDKQGTGFVVVDGQQRLNGIALGFLSFDERKSHARLWIDLSVPDDKDQQQFEFYLCTSTNPFGVNGPVVLTRNEKRLALASIDKEYADDSELSLKDTYPYKAKLPVPFYEFWQFVEEQLEKGDILASLSDFAALFPKIDWHLSGNVLGLLSTKFAEMKTRDIVNDLVEPLKRTVINEKPENNYQIPIILIKKGDGDPQRLGKLFERVNINGEVPPQAELFFSALKLRYPLINNYVADVYNNSKLQGLLTPTEIVLTALRLIDPKIPGLELNLFDKIAKENNEKLKELMQPQADRPSKFMQCLLFVYDALHYDKSMNDIGLPRQLLVTLRPRVWQILAIWVKENLEKIKERGIQSKDRLNMIRFALLDSLNYFIEWNRSLSTYINGSTFTNFLLETNLTKARFPALNIFKNVRKEIDPAMYTMRLRNPLAFKAWLHKDATQTQPNDYHYSNENSILMYAQRDYLVQWENYPFHLDIDHIVPAAWMVFRAGPRPESDFWKVRPKVESYWRYTVLHCIGNYRYLPDSLNRAYGDKSPKDKFICHPFDLPTNSELHERAGLQTVQDALDASAISSDEVKQWVSLHERAGLRTVQDVLDASAISNDEVKQWESLSEEDPRVWTTKRFACFKQLVDLRRFRLYRIMFEAMQWDEWVEAIKEND